ncbi:gamma-butyrobetaine hydroxylase-like domain-containing protein [Oryzibacter oryziterrae]|uniref:gamma-butyrobetaine hydroxylase-like domain-containing protein n=1 Tax=Oryzibacter oryziterrae TaxID=2766474 RepID=UPI001F31AE8E|nr:DUF971 domain-containing protein [Oryzibacter oryziterrae]
MVDGNTAWPEELRLSSDKKTLHVAFDNGESYDLGAELLRVRSPSAEVQGHAPDQRQTVPRKKDVRIVNLEPVGTYAVRIVFDDTHQTGLYTWAFLLDAGRNQARYFDDYVAELKAKGLSR